MRSRSRGGNWKFWARLGVSLVLLAVLLTRVDPNELLPETRDGSHLAFMGLGILMTFVGIVASAWRWQRVLVAFEQPVGIVTLTRYYLSGQFVGNVLPSTIGGDVVRVSHLGRTIESHETAFASVAFERLTGFLALPVISIVGFAFTPGIYDEARQAMRPVLSWKRSWFALAIDIVTLLLLVVILYLAAHPKLAGRFAERDNWTRFIGAVHVGVGKLRERPQTVVGILGTAILYQVTVVISVYFAARALDISVPTAALFAFVPVVAIAQVVPLTVGGLGIREGLLVLFLGPFGVTETQAVALGLLWYAMVLVVSMLGAPSFAAGTKVPVAKPGDDATTGADATGVIRDE